MADKLSEEALCKDLRSFLEVQGWTCYPEVADIDLVAIPAKRDAVGLLLATPRWGRTSWGPASCETPPWGEADRVAIQAKLQANADVLLQAVELRGCTWRFVAVRRAGPGFLGLARHLGVGVLVMEEHGHANGKEVWRRPALGWRVHPAPRRFEVKRPLVLPTIVTDLPAGAASPRALTKWREAALLLCHTLRTRGWVSTDDFKARKLHPGFWTQGRPRPILQVLGRVTGASGRLISRYVIGAEDLMPDLGWKEIQAQLVAATRPDVQAINPTAKIPCPPPNPE